MISEQQAYVLHSRPYRETSAIVHFFTADEGKVSAVARGVQSKKSPLKSLLQPFQLLSISYSGKSNLKNLTHSELLSSPGGLKGNNLYAGFYVNEITMRLLPEELPQLEIFELYQACIEQLNESDKEGIEPTLRYFELQLLQQLGYGLDFSEVLNLSPQQQAEKVYTFIPQHGFCENYSLPETQQFAASHLAQIARLSFTSADVLKSAKRLTRLAFHPYLGNKPLASRELFSRAGREKRGHHE